VCVRVQTIYDCENIVREGGVCAGEWSASAHASPRLVPSDVSLDALAERTIGFSGADVRALCRDAAMSPVRRVTVVGRPAAEIRALMASGALNLEAESVTSQAKLFPVFPNLFAGGSRVSSAHSTGIINLEDSGLQRAEEFIGVRGMAWCACSAARRITPRDFEAALAATQPSVDPAESQRHEQWNAQHGSQ